MVPQTQFSDLPKEIRLEIWDRLLPFIEPRNIYLQVSITVSKSHPQHTRNCKNYATVTAIVIKEVRRNVPRPASRKLAQICRENREHLYPLLFVSSPLSHGGLGFVCEERAKLLGARSNPNLDTIVLSYAHHGVDASELFSPLLALTMFEEASNIQNLRIDNGIWQVSKTQLGFSENISRLTRLRRLCLVGAAEELLVEERGFLEGKKKGLLEHVELECRETVDGWLGGERRRWGVRDRIEAIL